MGIGGRRTGKMSGTSPVSIMGVVDSHSGGGNEHEERIL